MILIDANILIYAHVSRFPQHETARSWLDAQLNSSTPIGLPWGSLLAFMRVVTNARIFPKPEPMFDAWTQVVTWLGREAVWIPQPTERHAELLGRFVKDPGVSANMIPDLHLATLALEHGLTLCSADGDFARFPGLRWVNPLATAGPRH